MKSREFDILIVGGGPAGISTWLHLQREHRGLAERTLVIEKAVYPRDKLCAGGLVRQADRVLRNLNIDLKVPSVSIRQMEYRFGKKELRFVSQPYAFRVVRRYEFDHALARVAVERGLNLHEGEAFRRFHRHDDAILVETDLGQYSVRALVGADGALSMVRRAMNLREGETRLSRALEVVTPPSSLDLPSDTAVFDFTPVAKGLHGYVWDFPSLKGGMPSFSRGIYDSGVLPARPPIKLNTIFSEALQQRDCLRESSTWSGHPGRWFASEGVYAQPNVLLVGDSAGAEPIFGEGISYALRYGALAAQFLIHSFKRRNFSFVDYRDRLMATPMGISLSFESLMAKQMYQDGPRALEQLYRRFSHQAKVTYSQG